MKMMVEWLQDFVPGRMHIGTVERVLACTGALVGILVTGLTSHWLLGSSEALPWLIAPMGASAVLLFAVPTSPLAQPWSILGGNMVSAAVGVTAVLLIDDFTLAAACAVGGAIGAMFACRCLHPPGGAVALSAALGGPAIAEQGYQFVLSPVGINSLLLLLVGLVFNNITARRYPHRIVAPKPADHGTSDPPPGRRLSFTHEDLETVLDNYKEIVDVSDADLETLFLQTEMQAYGRRMGGITCADIMSRDVVEVNRNAELTEAWKAMESHRIKALPVVDEAHRVIGIITQTDFMKVSRFAIHEGFGLGLRRALRRATRPFPDEPRNVAELMTSPVQTARTTDPIAVLVPILSDEGRHHVPVVDDDQKLVGMVTQTDLVAALYRGANGKL